MPLRPGPDHRKGIIENAAGVLVCPLCRQNVRMEWTVVATATCRSWISHQGRGDLRIEPAAGGRLSNEGVVSVYLNCPAGHRIQLSLVQEDGAVTTTTEWDDEIQDREEPND